MPIFIVHLSKSLKKESVECQTGFEMASSERPADNEASAGVTFSFIFKIDMHCQALNLDLPTFIEPENCHSNVGIDSNERG